MNSEIAQALNELKLRLQFICRRANELESEFEICDDINLAVISALNMLSMIEREVPVHGRGVVAV